MSTNADDDKQLDPKELSKLYDDWWANRTPDEFRIQGLAFEFEEELFQDFTLADESLRKPFTSMQIQDFDGEWRADEATYGPDVTIDDWRFLVCDSLGESAEGVEIEGQCSYRDKTISILRGFDSKMEKSTILHEMIHAYEFMMPIAYREWVLIHLWDSLGDRVDKEELRKRIAASGHTLSREVGHNVLFLLKSFDIDLRNKWELGQTFAYGRMELFKGIENRDGIED